MSDFFSFLAKHSAEIASALISHVYLVLVSVGCGALVSIPLGILLSYHKKAARIVLNLTSLIQTIPGLVLLGFAMILFGIGKLPALIVLALYAILPILQNTYTGLSEVSPEYVDAARGIGMNKHQILFKVKLPLALPSIIGGTRLSTIYIVSWATLAGLIGAGGLGDLIWTGLATYENRYILAGAIPAALLAIILGALISLIQSVLTPRGLKKGKV